MIAPGDAAATDASIAAAEGLFRLGIASDLVAFSVDAVVAVLVVPTYEPVSSVIVVVTDVIGEAALTLYLVVRGVGSPARAGPEAA